MALLLASLAACVHARASVAPKPNILHILLDDFGESHRRFNSPSSPTNTSTVASTASSTGWADAGWHRPAGYTDVQSPNMNTLVQEGIMLERHYVFQFCSPTRSAMQSGRNPIHVNTVNGAPDLRNPANNDTGFAGIPRNMTGIGSLMLRGGYRTAMYGKWDAGKGGHGP
jgi:arylsulfatase A-like enzyme